MKYFKPDLLARCRSQDDDVADTAADEWERAAEAYRLRLKSIRSSLPAGVRRLVSRISLHDAQVLGMSFGKPKPRFSLRLRLEGAGKQPGEIIGLNYRVVGGPNGGVIFHKHSELGQSPHGSRWVLYSEFDVDEERGFFTHSLLLTGGLEVEVRFHSLSVQDLGEEISLADPVESVWTWPLVAV
jgi:hypothetical protein